MRVSGGIKKAKYVRIYIKTIKVGKEIQPMANPACMNTCVDLVSFSLFNRFNFLDD